LIPTTGQFKIFRFWVMRLYEENQKEREECRQPAISFKDYWNLYKHWLKDKYREER
jgi:hypothetical protein